MSSILELRRARMQRGEKRRTHVRMKFNLRYHRSACILRLRRSTLNTGSRVWAHSREVCECLGAIAGTAYSCLAVTVSCDQASGVGFSATAAACDRVWSSIARVMVMQPCRNGAVNEEHTEITRTACSSRTQMPQHHASMLPTCHLHPNKFVHFTSCEATTV